MKLTIQYYHIWSLFSKSFVSIRKHTPLRLIKKLLNPD